MMERTNEAGYLDLVRHVLHSGRRSENRTGVYTRSVFGEQLRYSLRGNRLAMLTTKFVSFTTVAQELLWFLRGDTNQQHLADKNVNIWRANSSRSFLDSRNLQQYREYESLGPIYGFQWRYFGASYIDCHTDYRGRGYDQLMKCCEQLQNNPQSRRIIMSAWNPCDLAKMALPPCHLLVQFEVNEQRKELSAHLYQRSADLMVGVPYNLLSYSLLIHILAHKCDLVPGELICSYGNVHIYEPHIQNALFQITRKPGVCARLCPLNIPRDFDFDKLSIDDFKVEHYQHQGRILYEMIV